MTNRPTGPLDWFSCRLFSRKTQDMSSTRRSYPTLLAPILAALIIVFVDSVDAQEKTLLQKPAQLSLPQIEDVPSPPYYTTEYIPPAQADPSEPSDQLQIGVTYTIWIPESVERIRGIIVHQHGCGEGSCKSSVTAAHDLHWQELARKHDCALLGPSFHQPQQLNCRLWCDPRNGSGDVFIDSLRQLADASGHPELSTAPWCLWGHSGGGFWSSLMQMKYPDRIVAIWFQSGTAFGYWTKHEIEVPEIPDAAMRIPMMANPGLKEKGHDRFRRAWDGNLAMFKAYRAEGAPSGFAPDPRTGHETGDSRYLAIPFFDACLSLRLPDTTGQPLRSIDMNQGWLAPVLSEEMPRPSAEFAGERATAVWLPSESVARAWQQFVKTGEVDDTSAPPAPTDNRFDKETGVLTWKAHADYQSGTKAFVIKRDGVRIGQVPEKPHNHYGRPLFQGMTYGDTPELPLRSFKFVDKEARMHPSADYQVIAINSVDLSSASVRSDR